MFEYLPFGVLGVDEFANGVEQDAGDLDATAQPVVNTLGQIDDGGLVAGFHVRDPRTFHDGALGLGVVVGVNHLVRHLRDIAFESGHVNRIDHPIHQDRNLHDQSLQVAHCDLRLFLLERPQRVFNLLDQFVQFAGILFDDRVDDLVGRAREAVDGVILEPYESDALCSQRTEFCDERLVVGAA